MASNHYGGIIWTNHALERLKQRGLSQELAWQAYKYPDRSFPGRELGTTEYQRRYDKSLVTLITKFTEKREVIVISAWVDPPMPGTVDAAKRDAYKKYQKASFWGKIWLTLKQQLGL
jgi:hypothetical protein